ncbi:hypothetical protein RA307_31440, partial [Xanthobacteraceae bacterium Astr-EGSB]|uniref:DUF7146 domain-containing protein n=1 Tax=Astrobacterium formosum TaxID=3069710 RepID=UPI0027B079F7|nr:hypothetical protein [Xanthobacteraceae bacterium Astr-EGSB]
VRRPSSAGDGPMISDLAFDAWKDRAALRPIDDVARLLQLSLKKIAPREWAGPCPRPGCGGHDRFAINLTKNVYNCRHCGGGDGIGLVMMARSLDFVAACEFINGEPAPDRDTRLSADDQERLAQEAAARAAAVAKRQADENAHRERERGRLYDIWHRAIPDADLLKAYLRLRLGTDIAVPSRLRLVREMPYYSQGADRGDILARAPAMVAPIVGADGRFRGLHFTYLDLARPNGKLHLLDAAGEPLPAKKVRGSKEGHWIELIRVDEPTTLVHGEGIEKVLAVWLALASVGRDLTTTAFWTSVDLGNLGGKSAASWTHPSLKSDKGRPQRVPGPVPDLDAPAIEIPDSVTDLVLLGDSTSDRFTTQCALARATARYAREGRTVRTAWAPADKDFDDVLREAA